MRSLGPSPLRGAARTCLALDEYMKEQKQQYEAWEGNDGCILSTPDKIEKMKKEGLIEKNAKLVHIIEAATYEEAMAIFNLRTGVEPYRPMGKPKLCSKGCGSFFYPEGSGECPYCGKIC